MRPLARVQVERRGDVPIAAIEGEIDASNASDLGIEIRATVDNRATALVVDLTPTRYLDSAGIHLLFALGEDLRTRQLTLRLAVSPGSSIARMLAITSLDKTLPTYATVEEALAGARP
jgi:anti-sigma B factor antagonist